MSFEVYDYRTDNRNILVTPEIRARLMRIEVGGTSGVSRPGRGHSHDLGHEVFLVLQGQAEFTIDGETQVLGPGQICIARTDQTHTQRNVGDEPVIMYLSVTPHIQPTHTHWTEDGEKAAPRFEPSTTYHVPPDRSTPTEELLESHLAAMETLTRTTEIARGVQRAQAAAFQDALEAADTSAALQARDAMWAALYPMFAQVYELAEAWNNLTYRTEDAAFL